MARRRVDDPRSDNALIAACNDGSAREAARAFEVLYRRHKDYVLLQTIVVLFALAILLVNLVVDLLYGLLDPRIRHS